MQVPTITTVVDREDMRVVLAVVSPGLRRTISTAMTNSNPLNSAFICSRPSTETHS